MKTFKIIDCWVSGIWITAFATASVIYYKEGYVNNILITGYFVVGGWQIISMIIHAVSGYFTQPWKARFIYHWISFVAVVTMPAGSVSVLYFTAPFMAIYYTWLCYYETYIKMKRPLDVLK